MSIHWQVPPASKVRQMKPNPLKSGVGDYNINCGPNSTILSLFRKIDSLTWYQRLVRWEVKSSNLTIHVHIPNTLSANGRLNMEAMCEEGYMSVQYDLIRILSPTKNQEQKKETEKQDIDQQYITYYMSLLDLLVLPNSLGVR